MTGNLPVTVLLGELDVKVERIDPDGPVKLRTIDPFDQCHLEAGPSLLPLDRDVDGTQQHFNRPSFLILLP